MEGGTGGEEERTRPRMSRDGYSLFDSFLGALKHRPSDRKQYNALVVYEVNYGPFDHPYVLSTYIN